MSEEMQHACIDCAAQAMERFNIEKDIAACAFRAPPKKYWAPAVFFRGLPTHARLSPPPPPLTARRH